METPTITEAPNIPPQIIKLEYERNEALMIALAKIEELRKELGNITYLLAYGREYPLRKDSVPDELVANSQALHRMAKMVLDDVKGIDYRQEEAAIKLEGFFGAYEVFMSKYAELLERHPDIAMKVIAMAPGMSALTHAKVKEAASDAPNLDAKYAA